MKSKLATISFIISLIPVAVFLTFFIVQFQSGWTIVQNMFRALEILIFFSPFIFFLCILSFLLGISALWSIKRRKLNGKEFAIVGVSLSVAMFLILAGVLAYMVSKGIPFA